MFEVGDRIVYGTHGVCEVTAIGRLSMSVADRRKKYYTLRPVYQQDSLIYVPVDNKKIKMRLILTQKESEEFIQKIPQIDTIWIANERDREKLYREALISCDCRELIRIIKTIYLRKLLRERNGKKVAAVDERYFRQAEDLLYGELSLSLDMGREKIEPYIREQIEAREIAQQEL